MDYTRQSDLISQGKVSQPCVDIIGCGAIGSAVAMALAKMGVNKFYLFDNDRVSEENLPNQMYRIQDLTTLKVYTLREIMDSYNNDIILSAITRQYTNEPLSPIVIVTTDSMSSRTIVWEQYLRQNQARIYIEARMGAEEGQVYTITSKSEENIKFYRERLYTDAETKPLPCTAKAIIYNVFMIASLVCRAYKAAVQGEPIPREMIFGLAQIHKYSFQIRK